MPYKKAHHFFVEQATIKKTKLVIKTANFALKIA